MTYNPKRILIVQTAFLGDVVLISALARETKRLFPSSIIDVLIIPQFKDVLQNNPNIKKILFFDKRKNKITSFIKSLLEIRRNHYDLAILPHSSTTTANLMLLGGIKRRIGFDRYLATKYLTDKVPFKSGIHRVEKNLELLSIFTNEKLSHQTELFPSEEDKYFASNIIENLPHDNRPVICIAPGSVWYTKRWNKENYISLTSELEKEKYNIIFIGSKDESDLCAEIISVADSKALNLAGKCKILESAAIIGKSNLTICNDSGVLHISNAMKTDVFAFFGPTVKKIGYFPFRNDDKVFEIDLDCRPCGEHGANKCPLEHHNCMKQIDYKMVVEEVKRRV